MDPRLFPKKVVNKLKLGWRPVLNHMSLAKNLPNLSQDSILADFINSTFSHTTEHLCKMYALMFGKNVRSKKSRKWVPGQNG